MLNTMEFYNRAVIILFSGIKYNSKCVITQVFWPLSYYGYAEIVDEAYQNIYKWSVIIKVHFAYFKGTWISNERYLKTIWVIRYYLLGKQRFVS